MKNKTGKIFVILLIAMVVLACSPFGLQYVLRGQGTATPTPELPIPEPQVTETPTTNVVAPNIVDLNETLVALYEKVSPGVVSIQFSTTEGEGLGSGFVVDKQGHIVTNYHVVQDVDSLEVHFASGEKAYAKVLGVDPDSDLAVISVDVPEEELMPLTLGDSDTAKVGQLVVAIGNPFGLSGTTTLGVISGRGRILDSLRTTASGTAFSAGDVIQTDALINPGNSGGPLLNLNGEVIGVNRAIQTSGITLTGEAANTGIGFAVSSNILRRVLPSLIENGYYDYPYLGLTALNSLSLMVIETLGLPQETGAYITDVVPGGPADQAGLRGGTRRTNITGLYAGGDLIIAADGHPVKEFSDLLSYMILNKAPGDVITFTILRDGEQLEVPVTLGSRP